MQIRIGNRVFLNRALNRIIPTQDRVDGRLALVDTRAPSTQVTHPSSVFKRIVILRRVAQSVKMVLASKTTTSCGCLNLILDSVLLIQALEGGVDLENSRSLHAHSVHLLLDA